MLKDENNIDRLFRDKLKNFEAEPPAHIWNNIEAELRKKRKKRFIVYMRRIAAILLLLLSFGSGYFIANYKTHKSAVYTSENVREETNAQPLEKQIQRENKELAEIISQEKIADTQKQNINNTDEADETTGLLAQIEKNKNRIAEAEKDEFDEHIWANATSEAAVSGEENAKPNIVKNNAAAKDASATNDNLTDFAKNDLSDNVFAADSSLALAENDTGILARATEDVFVFADEKNAVFPDAKSGKISLNMLDQIHNRKDTLRYMFYDKAEKKKEIVANIDVPIAKWKIGGSFSPVYAFHSANTGNERELELGDKLNVMQNIAKDSQVNTESEKNALISYSAGIDLAYCQNSRLSFHSGVYYLKKEQMLENIPVQKVREKRSTHYNVQLYNVSAKFDRVANDAIDEIKTNSYDGRLETEHDYPELPNRTEAYYKLNIDMKQKFEYVEIPLVVKYKLIDRKIDFSLNTGVYTGMLVKNRASIQHEDRNFWTGKTSKVNMFNYSASFGFGLGYQLNRKISLNVEPTIKYFLNPVGSDSEIFDFPYAFSVFTGLTYMF